MSVADRMAVLEHGEIRQLGSPRDIYMTPASRYVAPDWLDRRRSISFPPGHIATGRRHVDVARAAELPDLAMLQHGHAISDRHRLFLVVSYIDSVRPSSV